MFSKQISGTNSIPHNKRVAIIIFFIKNDNFFKTKSDQNIHQNAPNYIIFSGEHAPNPLAKRMEQHANL